MSHVPGQTLLLASQANKVIHRFSFLLKKPAAETRGVCITTASNVSKDRRWVEEEKNDFRQVGLQLTDFDLAGKGRSDVAAALQGVDLIFVIGGNTFYLLEKIRQSGFDDVLREKLREGVLYIGSSAGSIVAGPDIAFIEPMDNDPAYSNLTDYKGMELVDFSILPHVEHERFGEAARIVAARATSEQRLIGLRDDQGIVVRGCYAEVY